MKKRHLIYVRRITNLSDGRYCAGMGVDMLGFVVNPGDEDFVSPQQYQEMSGWIAGPKRVAEITSFAGIDLNEIIRLYAPDFLHIHNQAIPEAHLTSLPLIVEVPAKSLGLAQNTLVNSGLDIRYMLITGVDPNGSVSLPTDKTFATLLSIDKEVDNVTDLLQKSNANGISLQGTRELTPGLKDYDHLSRVLEEFDEG